MNLANTQTDQANGALLLSAEQTAGLLGVGERFLWTMHRSGELGPLPIKLGRRLLWSRFELERWVAARCPHRELWAAQEDGLDKVSARTVQGGMETIGQAGIVHPGWPGATRI